MSQHHKTANVFPLAETLNKQSLQHSLIPLKHLETPLDWITAVFKVPNLLNLPKGQNRKVLLLESEERSLESLGQFLKLLGYEVYLWQDAINYSELELALQQMDNVINHILENDDERSRTEKEHSLQVVASQESALFAKLLQTQNPSAVEHLFCLGIPHCDNLSCYTESIQQQLKMALLPKSGGAITNFCHINQLSLSRYYKIKPIVIETKPSVFPICSKLWVMLSHQLNKDTHYSVGASGSLATESTALSEANSI